MKCKQMTNIVYIIHTMTRKYKTRSVFLISYILRRTLTVTLNPIGANTIFFSCRAIFYSILFYSGMLILYIFYYFVFRILQIIQSGLLRYWERKYWREGSCRSRSAKAHGATISTTFGAIVVLAAGIIISAATLFIEIVAYKCKEKGK